ncbi:hypothetical protein KUTeg_013411 [Tegillarca granosa]|uniref:Seipin n=1 Tax=Tegillarca granosa TaxID=220873 RepID=A0ABQ9EX18_TEGGR|nr:hypothetical protein KUTeg_013411 [Tegillarca granosa]
MILMFVRNCLDWIQDTFHWVLLKLKDTLAKIALTVFVLIILLWLSIFLYGVFYFAYVPPASYIKPIHLEFRVCENGIGMCSYPTANISLLKQGQDEVFMKGQSYKIIFDIEIPESPTNKQLEQKQLISTEFFSNYFDDAYNPAVGAVIQVQSMKIELYTSVLKIYATFSGIRYFMFHWPLLSSIVGITMNMAFLSFVALLSWYHCIGSNQKDNTDPSWSDRGTSNLAERRQNVRQMLERERQREGSV